MKRTINTLILLAFWAGNLTMSIAQITLLETSKITDSGLFFEGKQGKEYQFGSRITPHGDCLDIVNGYVFFAWYKGDMTQRNLMLSRKKVTGGTWKTIQFPDKHIGYRGDTTKGDSHNTAAVAISTIDNTVHLIYDFHAYNKAAFPDNFFNYRVSKQNGAFVPDEEWTIDLFTDKRNYLKKGLDYESYTYPKLFRDSKGRLIFEYRKGGSGNGDSYFATYDVNQWSAGQAFGIGRSGDNKRSSQSYSIYGSSKIINGQLHIGFSIRIGDFPTDAYTYNSGLFYAVSDDPFAGKPWLTADGKQITMPFTSPEQLKIGEPIALGIGNYMSSGPNWTVTPNNDLHFIATVSKRTVHYFRKSTDSTFTQALDTPNGDLFPIRNRVYAVDINEKGRVAIHSTVGGTNDWQKDYETPTGLTLRHGNAVVYENKIYYVAMEKGTGSAQPIHLLVYAIN